MYAHAISLPTLHGGRRGRARPRPLFLRRSTQHLHGTRATVRARRGAARVRPSGLRETGRVALAVLNALAWSALLYLAAS
jgi:hypothetical protein